MATFDTNIQQTTGSINVPQLHAVEDNSTANLISGLGNVALNTAQAVQQSALAGKKLIGQTNLANYSIQLGKLQNAVAQGTMSSAAARSRIRDLRNQVIANNPSLLPQIDSTTSSFLSDSGLGSDIVKGTKAEQQEEDIVGQMAKDGWNINANTPEDQKQDLIHAWQTQKLAQQQLQMTSAQIAVTRGKLGITSDQLGIQKSQQSLATGAITQKTAQIGLDMKLHQQAANQAIFTGANAWTTNFNSKIGDIVKKFNDSGKTPADQQAAVDQINLELAQITAGVSRAGIGGDQSVLTQAIAPMKSLAESATQFIQGKIQTQGYKDAVDNAMNLAKLSALNAADPTSLRTIGLMATSVNMSSALANVWGDRTATQILGKNSTDPASSKPADVAVGKDDPDYGSYSDYLDGIKSAIGKSNLGTLDKQGEHLLGNNLTNIANGLLNGNTKAKTPQDYNRIVQFLADPAINAYITKHPELMRTANLKGVSDMLAHEYTLNIEPLVRKEWQQAMPPQGKPSMANAVTTSTPYGPSTVAGFKQVPIGDVIHPEFTGGGIQFIADNNDPLTQQAAQKLNEKVAPVMGRLIRATATLEGTNNYRKVWNETYAGWFGQKPEAAPEAPKSVETNPVQAIKADAPVLDKATPQLMDSLFHAESGGDNTAVSPKGAVGIGQMMPATANALGYSMEDLKDPNTAKEASTKYLNMMLDRFDGKVKLALAAYNYGPTKVAKLVRKYGDNYEAIEPHLPKETRDYVPKVLGGIASK